uniref:Endonuclease n=1 Tax=Panagrellus redivivus TaxID=6233 RepID=A0A7E4URI0_PANRE
MASLPRAAATAAIAVGSYIIGANYPSLHENLAPSFLKSAKMATAVVPADRHQIVGVEAPVKPTDPEPWTSPSRAGQIMRFGWPGFDNLRTYEDFVLSYDRRTKTAHWVIEHLTPDRMTYDPSVDRSKCAFRPDESIHEYFRSTNEDYFRSGYDRGHLAPAGNHRKTQNAIDQTFYLTNMSPQVGKGFNRDKWNDLEKHVRKLARKNINVYICTGPLYIPKKEADNNLYVKYKVIGPRQVAVPTHFFKVALVEYEKDKYSLDSYLLPNAVIPDETPISQFLVPLDEIERAAGFLIFDKVPKSQIKIINGKKLGFW